MLREQIHIDGMPLHIIDTAGLREAPDTIERIGIERAWEEIRRADRILMMVDSSQCATTDPAQLWPELADHLGDLGHLTLIRNKADLSGEPVGIRQEGEYSLICLSAKQGLGIDLLREHLKQVMGFHATTEGGFMARRRHLDALERAQQLLETGAEQLKRHGAGELLAEDLRQAQQVLGEITGAFSSDELLGRIFSSFCIGK